MRPKSIITYNVNGIRSALKKGLISWIVENQFDIICLQETKAHATQLDTSVFSNAGYHHYWFSAEKKGYSGVAVLTKNEPDNVIYGCGLDPYDSEGRIIRLDFKDVTLVNTYFPSGSSGDARQEVKKRWLSDFSNYINDLRKTRSKIIITGDYNICHAEIDIHDPVRNAQSSGFLPYEREWISQFFNSGFIDTFRYFNPYPHNYTWWSYKTFARERNKGWRIDYISTSVELSGNLVEARILSEAKHSDHCPVYLKIIF